VSRSPAAARFDVLQIGIEEEFLLADSRSRYTIPRAADVVADAAAVLGDRVELEFFATQLEIRTEPHTVTADLRTQLVAGRLAAARSAARAGCLLVASPSAILTRHPLPLTTSRPRYREVGRHLAATVAHADAELSGCHVHLGALERAEALALANHLRPWLPAFQALAANSPFIDGRDSGYASSRFLRYERWPTVGPAPILDEAGYDALVDGLVDAGTILDRRMIYWYARPSEHVPTLEVRVADVNADVDDTVLLAVLLRALAAVLLADIRRCVPAAAVGDEAVLSAHRQAAQHGLRGIGVDPVTHTARPLGEILDAAAELARPGLEAAGDLEIAYDLLSRMHTRGNGAERQRALYRERGSLTDIVDYLALEVDRGAPAPGVVGPGTPIAPPGLSLGARGARPVG
jgi:carboxylate-amine ligase